MATHNPSLFEQLKQAVEVDDQPSMLRLATALAGMNPASLTQQLESKLDSNATGNPPDHLVEAMNRLLHEVFPDTRERLQSIVEKTERAAQRSIDGAEKAVSLLAGMIDSVAGIRECIESATTEDSVPYDTRQIDSYLRRIEQDSQAISEEMNRLMLAQDYQDLTGQMVNQVIAANREIEALVPESLNDDRARDSRPADSGDEPHRGVGPQLASASRHRVAHSQTDVDDLLEDLGL